MEEAPVPPVWLVSFAVVVPRVGDRLLGAALSADRHFYRTLRSLPLTEERTFEPMPVLDFVSQSCISIVGC